MLARLTIQNYAIIDALEITFDSKLNIITGETGAGKSIIMGALGLILGERADPAVLRNKEKKCVIEGSFDVTGKKAIAAFLLEQELDGGDEVVLRREIATNGKSRAFVNDTPVTLNLLGELTRLLVDLHQQFDTLSIGEADFQRAVLDALAGNAALVEKYQTQFKQWNHYKTTLTALQEQQAQFNKEADYNRFQFQELEEAAFRPNELEEADVALKMMSHAEGVRSALARAADTLSLGDSPLAPQLKQVINQLQAVAAYHPQLPAILQRLQSAQIELQDIADDVERMADDVNTDPRRIEELNERISLGYRLQKKHGVNSTAELLRIRDELNNKLQAVLETGDRIAAAEKAMQEAWLALVQTAAALHTARLKQVKPLADKVNKLLVQVGMPNARLQVTVTAITPALTGADAVEFLFDANKSGQFQPVGKVASGGELSRLMLCIKSLVAKSLDLPTLIFDEIDTGISGEAARQVGLILKELATQRQVICITHQPQIAGRADAHYFVYKEVMKQSGKETVTTGIRTLNRSQRVDAIAKMIGGENPSAAAMANAQEMVDE